jgi:ligand-binding sensor domain-containing protein
MKNVYHFAVFIFIIFFQSLFFAQIPGMINYNQEDGLNCTVTYRLIQDEQGFLWIGSDNGFFRFDGVEFKNYNAKQGLKNIEVLGVLTLKNKILIIPFLNNIAYLEKGAIYNTDTDPELRKIKTGTGGFEAYYNKQRDESFILNTTDLSCIYKYKNGKVQTIPLYINPDKNRFSLIDFDTNSFELLLSDQNNNIFSYNILKKKKHVFTIKLEKKEWLVQLKNNILISINKNGNKIFLYRRKGDSFNKIHTLELEKEHDIHDIHIDDNERLLVSLNSGGVLFFNQPITNFSPSKKPYLFLQDYVINDILIDKDKNIWFSSRDNGIFFISKNFFANYINYFSEIKNSANITSIAANSNSVFLGYNVSKAAIYSPNKKYTEFVLDHSQKNEHRAIFANDKTVLFGQTQRVSQMNLSNFKSFTPKSLQTFNIKNIVPYLDNEVLICNSSNVSRYNYRLKKIVDTLFNERSYTALSYQPDSLFVGSFKDLYKVNVKNKQKKLFLEGYYFTDLKKLKDNLYAGATNLHGIVIFNNHKILKQITQADGLVTNQIKKIDIEKPNILWASTNTGLIRIELTKNKPKINLFTQTDGLPSDKGAGCVIKKDTLYIGTSKGLGILSIKELLTQQKFINKKVIINSVIIGAREYFDITNNLTTESPHNDIIFNLSFPDFTSQGKISYKYKMEGLNDNWNISNSSKIIYNSLPPGKYIFKVFGLGHGGKQSYTYASMPIEIKPRFWQTWWFKAAAALLMILPIVIVINITLHKQRDKKLKKIIHEKKIAELELQAIKAQINPHFIYNCLNSIQFLLYKKDYNETENYLDIFSQMIRKTLHYSEKTFMSVQEETEYLSLYLNMEKLRLKDQLEYTVTVSERVNQEWQIPSLLVQPFVENAIKHGISGLKDRKGKIDIAFDYSDSTLSIAIEDNGVGIQNKQETMAKNNSFGVKLSQKRIDTFKQLFDTNVVLEINSLSEKTYGTQIKLYISPYENKNTGLHH